METDELKNVEQDESTIQTDKQNNQEVEPGHSAESQDTQEVQEVAPEDIQDRNIREMRIIKERAEKERDEAYALLQQMKDQTAQKPPVEPETPEEDLTDMVAADDLVEGKHLGKVTKKVKELEKQLKSYQQATTTATVETRLKQKYKDFDIVVSKENVEALVRNHPELGATLRSSKDLYNQAVTAYTMIKKMGIYIEDKFAGDRARAEENAAKPRPLASVSPQKGQGPLSKANAFDTGLTDELKAQLLKEMSEARSRH